MGTGNILIIASNKTLVDQLIVLLRSEGFSQIEYAISTNDARQKVAFLEPDIIIINSPLCSEPRIDFIVDISERTSSCIVVLTKNDSFLDMQYDLQHIGAIVLSKPLNRGMFIDTLHFLSYFCNYIGDSKNKKKTIIPISKDEEKLIIKKSKSLLINNLNLTEPCTHRYIQKQSMDLRISKVKVAEQIINYFLR